MSLFSPYFKIKRRIEESTEEARLMNRILEMGEKMEKTHLIPSHVTFEKLFPPLKDKDKDIKHKFEADDEQIAKYNEKVKYLKYLRDLTDGLTPSPRIVLSIILYFSVCFVVWFTICWYMYRYHNL